jgi:arginyl-tRNA synthetase
LHFAHGRHAAVGDSLTRLLRFAGYDVLREYYVNDAGNQVAMLALSVWARYMEAAKGEDWTGVIVPEVAFPENGYRGDYIRGLALELLEREAGRFVGADPPADMEPIKQFAIGRCMDMIRGTLAKFDVTFDVWQSERALHDSGEVSSTLAALEQAGFIERRDNAVWLKTTVLWGDDKDRVVVKSDGLPTYLLADIAYHRKKIERGFDELCDIWGADHHGHVPRMQAALKALGHDPNRLSVLLIQMVSLLRDGKPVAMGKREGEFISLDEVLDEIGRDATRFFYLMRRHDTPLEFDLELAKRQSMDNPVYYAQYAHARCASLLRRAAELQAPRMPPSAELFARLNLPEEIALLRRLSDFPDFVEDAAAAREPHRLVSFISELAGEFQSCYTRLQKVHGDSVLPQERQRVGNWRATWDWQKTAARLHWVEAIRQVLETALGLVGVSAPAVMKRIGEEGEEAS